MKIRTLITIGGILNTLMSLFHVFLCYQIHQMYASEPVYPLLQMLSISGTLLVIFFAYSSLLFPGEMIISKVGKSILLLNVLIYLARVAGEYLLFPVQNPIIIGICLLIASIYLFVFYFSWNVKEEYVV